MIIILLLWNMIKSKSLSYYGHLLPNSLLKMITSITFRRMNQRVLYTHKVSYLLLKGSAFIYSIALLVSLIGLSKNLVIYGIGVSCFIFYLPDLKLKEKYNEVDYMLNQSLPTYIMHLSLLLEAEFALYNAVQMIETESYLKLIMTDVLKEIQIRGFDSMIEVTSKVHHHGMLRLSRLLVQTQRLGDDELVPLLEHLTEELWREKKSNLLKKGEQASTKLVLPMMLSLLGVTLAITVPAIYQLYQVF